MSNPLVLGDESSSLLSLVRDICWCRRAELNTWVDSCRWISYRMNRADTGKFKASEQQQKWSRIFYQLYHHWNTNIHSARNDNSHGIADVIHWRSLFEITCSVSALDSCELCENVCHCNDSEKISSLAIKQHLLRNMSLHIDTSAVRWRRFGLYKCVQTPCFSPLQVGYMIDLLDFWEIFWMKALECELILLLVTSEVRKNSKYSRKNW